MKSQVKLPNITEVLYNQDVEFKDWINKQYIEWRGKTRATISDFAEYIGVSQSLMSSWMNGTKTPAMRTLPKLAIHYPGVYDILGLPNRLLKSSPDFWNSVPDDIKPKLISAIIEAHNRASKKGVEINSPEGVVIINSVIKEFGL